MSAVRADAVLPLLLALYGALLFLGPSTPLILPVMNTTVLHLEPRQLGLLFPAATGAGTVVGGVALASAGDVKRKGRIVVLSAVAWAAAFAAFAC